MNNIIFIYVNKAGHVYITLHTGLGVSQAVKSHIFQMKMYIFCSVFPSDYLAILDISPFLFLIMIHFYVNLFIDWLIDCCLMCSECYCHYVSSANNKNENSWVGSVSADRKIGKAKSRV